MTKATQSWFHECSHPITATTATTGTAVTATIARVPRVGHHDIKSTNAHCLKKTLHGVFRTSSTCTKSLITATSSHGCQIGIDDRVFFDVLKIPAQRGDVVQQLGALPEDVGGRPLFDHGAQLLRLRLEVLLHELEELPPHLVTLEEGPDVGPGEHLAALDEQAGGVAEELQHVLPPLVVGAHELRRLRPRGVAHVAGSARPRVLERALAALPALAGVLVLRVAPLADEDPRPHGDVVVPRQRRQAQVAGLHGGGEEQLHPGAGVRAGVELARGGFGLQQPAPVLDEEARHPLLGAVATALDDDAGDGAHGPQVDLHPLPLPVAHGAPGLGRVQHRPGGPGAGGVVVLDAVVGSGALPGVRLHVPDVRRRQRRRGQGGAQLLRKLQGLEVVAVAVEVEPVAALVVEKVHEAGLRPLLVHGVIALVDVVRLRPPARAAAPVPALPAPLLAALRAEEVVAAALLVREHAAARIGAGLGVLARGRAPLHPAHLLHLLRPGPRAGALRRRVRAEPAAEAEAVAAPARHRRPAPGVADAELAAAGGAPYDPRVVVGEGQDLQLRVPRVVLGRQVSLEHVRGDDQSAPLAGAPQLQAVRPADGPRVQVALEEGRPVVGAEPVPARQARDGLVYEADGAQRRRLLAPPLRSSIHGDAGGDAQRISVFGKALEQHFIVPLRVQQQERRGVPLNMCLLAHPVNHRALHPPHVVQVHDERILTGRHF
mmetsp:Transcript_23201/g.64859  ORF Transcript_23201/g.64859 Transcript_23201/m.64859 type:complete len:717 (-) Transcript_23201:493-2643(-)